MFNFWGYKTLSGHRAETAPELQPTAADELVHPLYFYYFLYLHIYIYNYVIRMKQKDK